MAGCAHGNPIGNNDLHRTRPNGVRLIIEQQHEAADECVDTEVMELGL